MKYFFFHCLVEKVLDVIGKDVILRAHMLTPKTLRTSLYECCLYWSENDLWTWYKLLQNCSKYCPRGYAYGLGARVSNSSKIDVLNRLITVCLQWVMPLSLKMSVQASYFTVKFKVPFLRVDPHCRSTMKNNNL